MNDKQFCRDVCFLAFVGLLIVIPVVCLFKSAGGTGVAVFGTLGIVILPMFLAKPAVIYFTSRRVARRMKTNKKVDTIRLALLGAFFAAAAFYIFHMTGWILFAVFAFFAVIFAPLLLTEPAPLATHPNVVTDPTFQRMPGNIYHREN